MKAFIDDLKYAQATGTAVRLTTLVEKIPYIGVQSVDEEEGFVSLFAPVTLGDDTTTRKVALDAIVDVTVTDVSWN
jgi:hypothetical protein